MLLPVEGEQYGPASENGFPTLLDRFIAAPGLSEEEFAVLEEKAAGTDITLLRSGLRDHMGGFDTSITWADGLVADTVTCVVDSNSEEVRLGTMVAEVSIMLVRKKAPRMAKVERRQRSSARSRQPGRCFLHGLHRRPQPYGRRRWNAWAPSACTVPSNFISCCWRAERGRRQEH